MQLDELKAIAEKHKSSRKKIILRSCMSAGCMSSQADVTKKISKPRPRRKVWRRMSKCAGSAAWVFAAKDRWWVGIKMANTDSGNL